MNIPAPEPVNLIHHAGRYYSRVTLSITGSEMKIATVTLDADLRSANERTEHEIESKGARSGLAFVLPPDSDFVVRDLPEFP